jgi:hypothetical protein
MTDPRLAYHEAGHAVVGVALGRVVGRVSIVEDDDSAGHAAVDLTGLFDDDGEIDAQTAAAAVMGWWAGALAEERVGSTTEEAAFTASGDLDKIVDIAIRVTADPDPYIEELRLATVRLLDEVWPDVVAVADALLTERTISADRVHALAPNARARLREDQR